MKIAHYKRTKIASAPDELVNAINKYTPHKAELFHNIIPREKFDIVHLHNRVMPIKGNKKVIQYHSEPNMVDLTTNIPGLVIAQYHATLREYSKCNIVRNIIDFNQQLYDPNIVTNKIRIGFSPSRKKKFGKWHNKGFDETSAILMQIQRDYPDVEVDIITDVPLDECLIRKNNCNIIIDECVTSSYHRSGLEGLALGKLTICSIDDKVDKVLKDSSGSDVNPFENIWINQLRLELSKIIDFGGIDFILERGKESRRWIEEYWQPEQVINEYIKIYENL